MDEDNDEVSQAPSTSSTDTRIAHSGRSTPSSLPPGTLARSEMRQTVSQQRATEEQTAIQTMVRRLECMDSVMAVVILNTSEYTKAYRDNSENCV